MEVETVGCLSKKNNETNILQMLQVGTIPWKKNNSARYNIPINLNETAKSHFFTGTTNLGSNSYGGG